MSKYTFLVIVGLAVALPHFASLSLGRVGKNDASTSAQYKVILAQNGGGCEVDGDAACYEQNDDDGLEGGSCGDCGYV